MVIPAGVITVGSRLLLAQLCICVARVSRRTERRATWGDNRHRSHLLDHSVAQCREQVNRGTIQHWPRLRVLHSRHGHRT